MEPVASCKSVPYSWIRL